jgi:lipopolysaccharide transport system ATP-binding protein
MARPIITVSGISKRYILGQIGMTSLRDDAARLGVWTRARLGLKSPAHAIPLAGNPREFWALRDVSFDVQPGEVVGIVGRNGAGKSTLLKILSRITEPTTGEIRVRGRVASLLEVGTGFHPELSGRENIFLNGAVLGMKRHEIQRKFDEIVAFAEVSAFLDTPVKRYSSGMYVRLAFAVAAHLEPEVLIVDEVLAVGDLRFQRKCLEKIRAISEGAGRTVLFVSHNMDAVSRLCNRTVLMEGGRLLQVGSTAEIVERYQSEAQSGLIPGRVLTLPAKPETPARSTRFTTILLRNTTRPSASTVFPGESVEFELTIEAAHEITEARLAISLGTPGGTKLVNADSAKLGLHVHLRAGLNTVHLRLPQLPLAPGEYFVGLHMADERRREVMDTIDNQLMIRINEQPSSAHIDRRADDGHVHTPFTFTLGGV